MSIETIVTISAITEFVVLSAITLTLLNAFSHGAVARRVFGNKQQPSAKPHRAELGQEEQVEYLRAA